MNIYGNPLKTNYKTNQNTAAVYVKENTSAEPVSHTYAAFSKGQTIKGIVTDIKGNDVTITLSDSSVLTARAEDSTLLSIGQQAVFEVTQSDSTLIALKLISGDNSDSAAYIIEKALENAGLAVNERNKEIVQALLNNKLPINSDSIHNLLKQSVIYHNASADTLAIMNKYDIPINEISSVQFEAYKNHEGSLTHELADYTKAIIAMLADKNVPEGAAKIVLAFLSSDNYNTSDISESVLNFDTSDEGSINTTLDNINRILNTPASDIFSSDVQNIHSGASLSNAAKSETLFSMSEFTQNTLSEAVNNISRFVNPENSPILDNDIFKAADSSFYIPSPENSLELPLLLQSGDYKNFFHEVLLNHFTLFADELKKPGTIKNFYDRLDSELTELEEFARNILNSHSENDISSSFKKFSSKTGEVRDSLDFMKTLNHIFTYIQLPMKLSGKAAHADLYVYRKNKKELLASETVRVLIHLDMDNLGALDIHLMLKDKHLDVGFYTEDASAEPLISSNLMLLKQSLEKKGFLPVTSVHILENRPDPVRDYLLNEDRASDVKCFTFDKRA